MKKLLFVLMALVGCSTGNNLITHAPQIEKQSAIDWQPFSSDMTKVSLALGKSLFIYLKDENCEFCSRMDRTTFSDEIIVDLINKKLIPISIDVTKNPEYVPIFYKDGSMTIPKFVIIRTTESGSLIIIESTGYKDSFKILQLINIAEDFIQKKIDETE